MKIPLIGAGNGEFPSALDAQNIITCGARLNLFDKQSVNEEGTVNAGESVRPQLFLDSGYGPAKHVSTCKPVQQDVIPLSLNRNDLSGIDEQDLALGLDGDSRRFC